MKGDGATRCGDADRVSLDLDAGAGGAAVELRGVHRGGLRGWEAEAAAAGGSQVDGVDVGAGREVVGEQQHAIATQLLAVEPVAVDAIEGGGAAAVAEVDLDRL